MHDVIASRMSLARTILSGIDPTRDETSVRTASLVLLLNTVLELGAQAPSPLPTALSNQAQKMTADNARRTVASHIASFGPDEFDPFSETPNART